jgi:hypothetical protein
MKRHLLLTLLAIVILLLAVGGWSVAAVRAVIRVTQPAR